MYTGKRTARVYPKVRILWLFALASLAAALVACTGQFHRPTPPLVGYEKIGIVPVQFNPRTDLNPFFARGPVEGAVKGGGLGGVGGIAGLASIDPWGALVGVLLLPVTVSAGAIVGVLEHTPKDEAKRIDELIERALLQDQFQLQLAKRIVDHAVYFPAVERDPLLGVGPETFSSTPDYDQFFLNGYDAVIEVGIEEIAFEDVLNKDGLRLAISAKARVVTAKTDDALQAYDLLWRSAPRGLTTWVRQEGRLISQAISAGVDFLASKVVTRSLGPAPM